MATLQICMLALTLLFAKSQKLLDGSTQNCLPPSIKKQSDQNTLNFLINTDVQIPCIAKGDGKLNYSWLKNGEVLNLTSPEVADRIAMGPGTGTLNIKAQETDEAIYQCSVRTACGTSLSKKTSLQLARSVPFPRLDKPTEIKRVLGSSLKLDCKPPESVPRAKISWVLVDAKDAEKVSGEDSEKITVVPDSRINMDFEGNLYFTTLKKEDERGQKIYVCQAENVFTRSLNIGEDKKITVQGTTVSDRGVELMWYSGNQTLVLVGRRTKLKCIFSGHPEPTISWSRLTGGDLAPARMTYEGNELVINDAEYSDAGEYRCSGRNVLSNDTMSHTFKVTVEAAPAWKSQPRDMAVGVEESASLDCDATGRPTPTVEWLINGKPFHEVPASPRRVLQDNTLIFTNLETSDSLVVQCNASNIHGSIWSDVYLYVQALPPKITQKPDARLVVAERREVRVPCHVTGKPKPRVIWYKNNQQLVHEKFQIMDNGDLVIQNTVQKDSGLYRCFAKNRFGDDEADGEVMVRERTQIVSRPMDAQVDYTNSVTFMCGATTDHNENLKIRWFKDGEPVVPSERVVLEDNSLIIRETTSKDTASYTCLAGNGLDNDTATATLKVKAVPDPPYNVSVEECLSKQASVKWLFEEKMRNFDNMTKFIVEYMTEYKPDVWMLASSVPYPAFTSKVDLSPYAKYRFRVRAVNAMGMGEASEASYSWCETPMSIPNRNPDNVHTDESSTGFLVVKWKPMDQIDLNGPRFRYEIEVEEQGSGTQQTFVVDDYQHGEKRIAVDNVYTPYMVKVRSVNQVGKAMSSPQTVTGHSGEAKPLVVPENFELDPEVNVTATSAGFRWDPVDTSPDLIRGQFSGYKVQALSKAECSRDS